MSALLEAPRGLHERRRTMSDGESLSARLKRELERAKIGVDQLAARTKVPRSTLRLLLGEDVIAIAPGRVYLRGHLKLVARELGIDLQEAEALFDERFPEVEEAREVVQLPRG